MLLVEDESRIAMLLRDMLEETGCEVVATAARLDDALDQATSQSFEIAVLDVNLGGKPVYPVASALLERGVPFVFATGYGSANVPQEFRSVPVVQKPFVRRQLEQALRAALDG
ncbi:MAG: response regulator [Rhodanobacteraceae bacterium]